MLFSSGQHSARDPDDGQPNVSDCGLRVATTYENIKERTFMRKTLWVGLALLLCAAFAMAQSETQAGQSDPQSGMGQTSTSSDTKAKETTVEGCLMGSGGNFTLTDATGIQYQLQGDTEKLSANVNKEVKVKGSLSSSMGAGGAGAGTASDSSAAGAGAPQVFNVMSVKKTSDTCKNMK